MDALAPTPPSRLASPRRLLRLRSDAALAERYADGDEGAFAVLFERHRASVLAVCMGVLSSRHDAEDAAQESFAALAVTLRGSPPRELRAWLVRVARNAAIDVARRQQLRIRFDGEMVEDRGPSVDCVAASQSVKHELESVLAGIRELPESQRTALLMRELAGHSYGEIAALCRSYRRALRDDAKALKGLVSVPAGGVAGGGALFGGLAAKGALLGAGVAQMTAACVVSVCAVGGIVLLTPGHAGHHHGGGAASSSRGVRARAVGRARSDSVSASQGRVAASALGSSRPAAAAGAPAHPGSKLGGTGGNGASGGGEPPTGSRTSGAGPSGSGSSGSGPGDPGAGSSEGGPGSSPTGSSPAATGGPTLRS